MSEYLGAVKWSSACRSIFSPPARALQQQTRAPTSPISRANYSPPQPYLINGESITPKEHPHDSGGADKRAKTKKQWRVPRGTHNGPLVPRTIQAGDSGIFATCNKGREKKCVGELRDLFAEYAELLYGEEGKAEEDEGDGGVEDIEKDIKAEIEGIQKPAKASWFVPVKLEVQCVVFFKTIAPVEPVKFVQKICEDALANPTHKRTRTAKRLAPMTLMGKATMEGLESVAREVLKPQFHEEPVTPRKFAIRPNMRNHNIMKRDAVINLVAGLVGQPHKVDLKNYDLLIMVEIYQQNKQFCYQSPSIARVSRADKDNFHHQNICGVSVVDHRYEELKRYNLAEIFDPTPKDEAAVKAEGSTGAGASASASGETAPPAAEGKEDNVFSTSGEDVAAAGSSSSKDEANDATTATEATKE
ncbi:hypothetical protein Q7P37_008364 [Cladosporium fusiforme]